MSCTRSLAHVSQARTVAFTSKTMVGHQYPRRRILYIRRTPGSPAVDDSWFINKTSGLKLSDTTICVILVAGSTRNKTSTSFFWCRSVFFASTWACNSWQREAIECSRRNSVTIRVLAWCQQVLENSGKIPAFRIHIQFRMVIILCRGYHKRRNLFIKSSGVETCRLFPGEGVRYQVLDTWSILCIEVKLS